MKLQLKYLNLALIILFSISCSKDEDDNPSNDTKTEDPVVTETTYYFEASILDTTYRFTSTNPGTFQGISSVSCRIQEFEDDFYSGVDINIQKSSYDDFTPSDIEGLAGDTIPLYYQDYDSNEPFYGEVSFQTPYYMETNLTDLNETNGAYMYIQSVQRIYPDFGSNVFNPNQFYEVTGVIKGYIDHPQGDVEMVDAKFKVRYSQYPK